MSAVRSIDDIRVYSQTAYTYSRERIAQNIELFNQASNNALLLSAGNMRGDYDYTDFIKSTLTVYRRDPASGASVTADTPEDGEIVKVKVGGGAIMDLPSGVFQWADKRIESYFQALAEDYADQKLKDILNNSVAALVAAMENVGSTVVNDVSATAGVSQNGLNNTFALFGDRSQAISTLIMRGVDKHKLIGEAITNSNTLFTVGDVAVMEGNAFGQGRVMIVSDIPALYVAGTPNKNKILCLTQGSIEAMEQLDITAVEPITGTQNLGVRWQANYSFSLSLKGYAWDVANGGAAPSTAVLTTGTNWDLAVASIKDSAGTLLIGNADQ